MKKHRPDIQVHVSDGGGRYIQIQRYAVSSSESFEKESGILPEVLTYVIAVPTDVTEVEKKAFFDLVVHSTARAREVNIVERGIADAIGLNLRCQRIQKDLFIVNFGGATTELSVTSRWRSSC